LLLGVKDENGADLLDVTVTLDGVPLDSRLRGTAIDVDPGPHVFTFDASGRIGAKKQVLVMEGERQRRETVVLVPVAPVAPADGGGFGARRAVGVALGGAGVAAAGLGTAFGLLAMGAWNDAKSVCGGTPSSCDSAAHAVTAHGYASTEATDAAVSTGAFIGGGALLVAGATLFFAGRRTPPASQAAWGLAPVSGGHEAGVQVFGSF
jgi:hypothetical protein